MPTSPGTSDLFTDFFEKSSREFSDRYRQSALKMIENHKAALQQFGQHIRDQHESGSTEFSKFMKMLMAGQMQMLTLLRDAEQRSFDLQSGMLDSYLSFLDDLKSRLEQNPSAYAANQSAES